MNFHSSAKILFLYIYLSWFSLTQGFKSEILWLDYEYGAPDKDHIYYSSARLAYKQMFCSKRCLVAMNNCFGLITKQCQSRMKSWEDNKVLKFLKKNGQKWIMINNVSSDKFKMLLLVILFVYVNKTSTWRLWTFEKKFLWIDFIFVQP